MPKIDWMPIETAPRDGTEVLLYAGSRSSSLYSTGKWLKMKNFVGSNWHWKWVSEPTHWAELNPPTTHKGEEE